MKKTRPLESIRRYCLQCCAGSLKEVRLCPSTDCILYPYRFGKGVRGKSTLKAIRKRCLDCGEGTSQSVRSCEFPKCPLFPYRTGHNPARRGIGRKGGNPSLKKA
ncbi:MAG: restriction endonuclease [Candidatus Heimdallarchaeaceae archaeon]